MLSCILSFSFLQNLAKLRAMPSLRNNQQQNEKMCCSCSSHRVIYTLVSIKIEFWMVALGGTYMKIPNYRLFNVETVAINWWCSTTSTLGLLLIDGCGFTICFFLFLVYLFVKNLLSNFLGTFSILKLTAVALNAKHLLLTTLIQISNRRKQLWKHKSTYPPGASIILYEFFLNFLAVRKRLRCCVRIWLWLTIDGWSRKFISIRKTMRKNKNKRKPKTKRNGRKNRTATTKKFFKREIIWMNTTAFETSRLYSISYPKHMKFITNQPIRFDVAVVGAIVVRTHPCWCACMFLWMRADRFSVLGVWWCVYGIRYKPVSTRCLSFYLTTCLW